MTLEFHSVENAGDLEKERVILRATSNGDAADYAVFQCQAVEDDDGDVMAGPVPNAYWFSSRVVKKGDWVVLYSKKGALSEKIGEKDRPSSYFFYWHSDKALWEGDMVPVLVDTPKWEIGKIAKPKRVRSAR